MKKRFQLYLISLAAVCFLCAPFASTSYAEGDETDNTSNTPEGYWQTIPDDDGSPSVVHIWLEEGKAYGKVVRIYSKPGKDPNPICDECEGALKDRPIIGMTILYSLSRDGDKWSGGTILDPNIGKVYKCYIKIIENGAKLKVRGFIGFSLLGRTQYWEKVPEPK